jgi:hypothetical protein
MVAQIKLGAAHSLGYRISTHDMGQTFPVYRYRFCRPGEYMARGAEHTTPEAAWREADLDAINQPQRD